MKEFSEYETTITYGDIDARVETARLQGYRAGYDKGYFDGTSAKLASMLEPKETHDIWHICDINGCDSETFATDKQAKESGWSVFAGNTFCPSHGGL